MVFVFFDVVITKSNSGQMSPVRARTMKEYDQVWVCFYYVLITLAVASVSIQLQGLVGALQWKFHVPKIYCL